MVLSLRVEKGVDLQSCQLAGVQSLVALEQVVDPCVSCFEPGGFAEVRKGKLFNLSDVAVKVAKKLEQPLEGHALTDEWNCGNMTQVVMELASPESLPFLPRRQVVFVKSHVFK
eukprot:1300459-Amphidinium_carterae.1